MGFMNELRPWKRFRCLLKKSYFYLCRFAKSFSAEIRLDFRNWISTAFKTLTYAIHVIWPNWSSKTLWPHVSSICLHRTNLFNHSCSLSWDLTKPILLLACLIAEAEIAIKKEKQSSLECKWGKPFWFPAVKQSVVQTKPFLHISKSKLIWQDEFRATFHLLFRAFKIKLANSKY